MENMKAFRCLKKLVFIISLVIYTTAYAGDKNEGIELYKKGADLLYKGQYHESIDYFDQVIEKLPKCSQAYILKARALSMNGHYDKVIEVIDEVLKFDDKKNEVKRNSMALATKAQALYNLGKYEESLECADLSLSFDKDFVLALYVRGASHGALGHYELAINDFDKTLVLDPDNKTNYETYLNRFCPLYKLKRYEEALQTCNKALKITDNAEKLPQIYSKKAAALNKLGKHAEALYYSDKALKVNSNDPLAISEKN